MDICQLQFFPFLIDFLVAFVYPTLNPCINPDHPDSKIK
ncbi:Uncharacterized protein dnl_16680 [Desulfonema limicola]|uniref:Uncharacterized protein n=1 Tax=Desulfonema limicola TaxID=45656 RepID=A0A975B5Y3_9BACT|nr:Uncharacterized protein dnl_16680 [Desulfonema limicola]